MSKVHLIYVHTLTSPCTAQGQCKCFRKPIGPVSVREFEDVLFRKFIAVHLDHTPSLQSISGYIGLMASQSW